MVLLKKNLSNLDTIDNIYYNIIYIMLSAMLIR